MIDVKSSCFFSVLILLNMQIAITSIEATFLFPIGGAFHGDAQKKGKSYSKSTCSFFHTNFHSSVQ